MAKYRLHISIYLANGHIIPFKTQLMDRPHTDIEIKTITQDLGGKGYIRSSDRFGFIPSADKIAFVLSVPEVVEE